MSERVKLTINGESVSAPAGRTILEAARDQGIDIPTLCFVEGLSPSGSCRLCVVEVEGSRTLVGSCHTPVAEGMVVHTHSPRVLEARRVILELMMASHPDGCLVCEEANRCTLRWRCMDAGVGLPRFRLRKRFFPVEDASPAIVRDMSKCILCRRCVSVCRSLKGEAMFSLAYRGFESKVVHGLDEAVGKADACGDCDECIKQCPTGALTRPRAAGEPRTGEVLYIKG